MHAHKQKITHTQKPHASKQTGARTHAVACTKTDLQVNMQTQKHNLACDTRD